jgi:hypothetical protein
MMEPLISDAVSVAPGIRRTKDHGLSALNLSRNLNLDLCMTEDCGLIVVLNLLQSVSICGICG